MPLPPIDPQRLWRHLETFSSSVRDSGGPAEAEAFAYAQRVLDEAGFETRLIRHEAYVSHPREAALAVGGEELACIAHAMSASTPGLEAPLRLADGDADLTGAVALARGLASPPAVRALVARGAAGAIFVNTERRYEMIVSPVWGSPDAAALAELPGIPVLSVARPEGERLRAAAGAGATVRLRSRVETGWRDIPLLEADLRAPRGDGGMVLFSGHVDAWHLGAMDNGGANAVMLEVGRALAERREALARDLRLAFWSGHSHGRYAGSAWYADARFEELRDRVLLHVNVDCVGARGATVLGEAACMPETRDLAARAVAAETGEAFRGTRYGRAGDQSFWGHGVSSVFMSLSEQPPGDAPGAAAGLFGGGRTGGYGPWWHTPDDTIDVIDPANLERDAGVYLRLVHETVTAPVPPLLYSRAAATVRERLEGFAADVGERLDLSLAVARARELEEALARYEARLDADPDPGAWRVLKAVARRLVPIDWVAGPTHRHDPALPQPPMPALAGIEELAATTDPDRARHLRVGLRREVNRIALELREALEAVEDALRAERARAAAEG